MLRLATALGQAFAMLATRREQRRTPGDAMQPFTWVALERARQHAPLGADVDQLRRFGRGEPLKRLRGAAWHAGLPAAIARDCRRWLQAGDRQRERPACPAPQTTRRRVRA
jgi:hypothetical protein